MIINYKKQDLINFEEKITNLFSNKKIKAPIHLYDGCEVQMIDIFSDYIDEDDWCCCSWRSHYQSLLKGVPEEEITEAICAGKSISLCFPKQRVISSAIVGGILPIAVGIAMGIKLKGEKHKVVCWMGEMTSETGAAHECIKYSLNHNLPIRFILEDNGKSVCTPTLPVWGMERLTYSPDETTEPNKVYEINSKVLYYKYESKYPHAGVGGARIQF